MDNATIDLPRILAVLGSREEASALERILEPEKWQVRFERSFPTAEAALLSGSFAVVICGSRFDEGHHWKDVLECVRRAPIPPLLIVVDRLADEALWAEVLNLGGYDVLMMPFERDEVLRVLGQAWSSSTPIAATQGRAAVAVLGTTFG